MNVAALFVEASGVYHTLLPERMCWGVARDARKYNRDYPVVCHPPCNLWVNFAAVNWKRYGRQRPAWYPGGHDGGCFASALASVRRCGGVLEHPAFSHAWAHHGLTRPSAPAGEWTQHAPEQWVCEVYQSAYGHRAQKRTWLLYVGYRKPPALRGGQGNATCQVGWFDRNKPTLSKKEASATPLAFAEMLIDLARYSRRQESD